MSPKYDAHLFICTNKKEKGACCADRQGPELRDRLKKLSRDPALGWGKRVRVNAAGCLGECEEGVAAVIYPEGRWLRNLRNDDASERQLIDAVNEALARADKK